MAELDDTRDTAEEDDTLVCSTRRLHQVAAILQRVAERERVAATRKMDKFIEDSYDSLILREDALRYKFEALRAHAFSAVVTELGNLMVDASAVLVEEMARIEDSADA